MKKHDGVLEGAWLMSLFSAGFERSAHDTFVCSFRGKEEKRYLKVRVAE